MFDRIMCVLVRIKVGRHLVMFIIQFMNLISVHCWTYGHKQEDLHILNSTAIEVDVHSGEDQST